MDHRTTLITQTVNRIIRAKTYLTYRRYRSKLRKFSTYKSYYCSETHYITTLKDKDGLSLAFETSLELPESYILMSSFRVNQKGTSFRCSANTYYLSEPDSIEKFSTSLEAIVAESIEQIENGIMSKFMEYEGV